MDRNQDKDRDLIRRCTHGDPRAWEEFVRTYVRLVAYVVRETLVRQGIGSSEADVDDVTEEIYAHIIDQDFRVLRNLREPFNLKAWLAVVARRKARDFARRRGIAVVSLDGPTSSRRGASPLGRLVGFPVDETSEAAEEVRFAVREAPLNVKERLMISLHFFKGREYAEISAITGVPENSIGPTLHRGLDKIREALQKRGRVS